jgi:imidazolonepropionase-like amidohydrolase
VSIDHGRKRAFSSRDYEVSGNHAAIWANSRAPVTDGARIRDVINLDAAAILNAGLLNVQRRALVIIPVMKKLLLGLLSESYRHKQNDETGDVVHQLKYINCVRVRCSGIYLSELEGFRMKTLASWLVVTSLGATGYSRPRSPSPAVLYEGGRLIIGDGSAPIEDGAFVVRNGHITAIGHQGAIKVPAGSTRVDLTGKTVMPAMINVHVHIGYEGYTSWGAENYTPQNVLDHLQREAFYGVGVTETVGSSPTDASIEFQRGQQAGKFPAASRFFFVPGMAPPNGGPDPVLRKATTTLHVVNEVSTGEEARSVVRALAAQNIKSVKIWVDDRRGTYPKMTPEVYEAIIDEAHQHGMIVHAHATTLPDQKAVVRAGADVLVHMVQNEKLDDEYLALLKEKKPYWATVIGLGDRTAVCEHDPFFEQALPAKLIATIRATTEQRPLTPSCGPPPPNAAAREAILAYNFPRMIASGARIVLGTDTGIEPGHTFGSGEHLELARWVQLGLTPAEAIVGATQRPAELLGLKDAGTLAVGKRADFIVLDANPLENIHNTRQISSVYLDGAKFDRDAMLARWKKTDVSQ